jgi:hypothetical protein
LALTAHGSDPQDYEIYLSNPRISDHPVTRVLPFTLRLTLK